jgi:hypothetical protein
VKEVLSLVLVELHVEGVTNEAIEEVDGETFEEVGEFEFGA